jgi:DNA-binding MarR family transcriptional regulator
MVRAAAMLRPDDFPGDSQPSSAPGAAVNGRLWPSGSRETGAAGPGPFRGPINRGNGAIRPVAASAQASHLVNLVSFRYQIAMTMTDPASDGIAELLVHIGRAARGDDPTSRLTVAQWTCLRFFARANAGTRTPSAFASFQATTRGTASQIIKTLERRGLLGRQRSATDGRSVCLDLTEQGRSMLADDPLRDLITALRALGAAERDALRISLSRLANAIAEVRGAPGFGTCRDCRHFTPSGRAGQCACLSMQITPEQIGSLCNSYTGAAGRRLTPRKERSLT